MDFLTLGYIYQGNGRAFCAGGDVAAVANDARGGLFVLYFQFIKQV
jgi:enoyl-CoA hydratase/carnithine racemase